MSDDKIYPTHDLRFPNDLFKSPRHAKKILLRVTKEFFGSDGDSAEQLDTFMQGTIKPRFVYKSEDAGYFPSIVKGCFYISVLVSKSDNEEKKHQKWMKVLSEIHPAAGAFFTRSITQIYMDFYNDDEKKKLVDDVEQEIEGEDEK